MKAIKIIKGTDTSKCMCCGKTIRDLEYIRYGGVCKVCWK